MAEQNDAFHDIVFIREATIQTLITKINKVTSTLLEMKSQHEQLKQTVIKQHEIIKLQTAMIDKLWYAPGMPGAMSAKEHFEELE